MLMPAPPVFASPQWCMLMSCLGAHMDGTADESEQVLMAMSTLSEEGVMSVKQVGDA